MLTGRDAYQGFFTRSPSLPELTKDSLKFEDPKEWVSAIKLKCGEYNPIDRTVENVSYGLCDILQPAADTIGQIIQSNLLSHRQLLANNLEWPRDSTIGRVSSPPRGYVAWARYVLQAHKGTLQQAGIYGAVYASMFDYGHMPPSWVRGVAEFWDPRSNTCWVGPEELTISLWELQAVSGLPTFGRRYEEYIPPDEELFSRRPAADHNRRGEAVFPTVYPILLHHYRQASETANVPKRFRGNIPVDAWIQSFLREDTIAQRRASLYDPFDLGLHPGDGLDEATAEPALTEGLISPTLPGIEDDLLLAGFLATWLSVFVLPIREKSVRAGVLIMASEMAQGWRVSLTPVVLARTYKMLKFMTESNISGLKEVVSPGNTCTLGFTCT